MSDNILEDIKVGLGIPKESTDFDAEVLIFTNSAISELTQLGVGPRLGFVVEGVTTTWSDYLGVSDARLSLIKQYIVLNVRLSFDPPEVGFILTAYKQRLEELAFRITTIVDEINDDLAAGITPTPTSP